MPVLGVAAEGAGREAPEGDRAAPHIPAALGRMSLSVSRQRRRLRGVQILRSLLEDYPNPEIVYIELWMLPRLFGE